MVKPKINKEQQAKASLYIKETFDSYKELNQERR
jgi:hypothetical protein